MARTSRTPKIRLGELLVAAGLVTDDKVRIGLEEQRRNNLFLGEALVQLGFVSEEAIAQAIIQHFNLPFLSATQFNVPPEVFNLFPERMYNEYQFIAVDKIERVIIIIAAGPINQDMMEELERVSECRICHYVSTWRDIFAAIQRNSKELGGEAQVELTGLGSMLLDAPSLVKLPTTATQRVKKLENPSMFGSPALSRLMGPAKSVNAANLSAMLSPLGVSPKSVGVSQISSSTPPSPRLTAFLKVAPVGNSSFTSSSALPPINRGATSASTPLMRALSSENLSPLRMGGAASSNLSAITGMPAASASASMLNAVNASSGVFHLPGSESAAGYPGGRKDKEYPDGKDKPPAPKRPSSFLTIRKD